jgi:DNA repair protein RecN (Recombination protein N)
MLVALYVKDFAIAHEVEIAPHRGLTVVSGETGAGKSLLVDALMLLIGARADSAVVRHGADRAELVARFSLDSNTAVRTWLTAAELDDGDECQLRRVIRADGGSRAYINGRPVTLTQLSELGAMLLEIHGQHEHQALLDRSHQLALLDAFAHHADTLAALRSSSRDWAVAKAAIDAIEQLGDRSQRRQRLAHQLDELQAQALAPSAIQDLFAEHRRQSHATTLIDGCAALSNAIQGDDTGSLIAVLHQVRQALSRLAEHEPRLSEVDTLLEGAQIQVDEAASTLERISDDFEQDPQRLEALEQQLSQLHDLARKHRVEPEELQDVQHALQSEFDELDNVDARLEKLLRQRDEAARRWRETAANISAARAHACNELSESISALMAELGMAGGQFLAQLEPRTGSDPHPDGAERVQFQVSANRGQPPRLLSKVASGGELSRISLAIQVATLGLDHTATMVFDEVDSGIGGAVAEAVGMKLRALGQAHQVLCVTHLPQVAAQGHHHLRVSKSDEDQVTRSRIEVLDAHSRIEELARMLGGADITATTLAHARQMLERAQL